MIAPRTALAALVWIVAGVVAGLLTRKTFPSAARYAALGAAMVGAGAAFFAAGLWSRWILGLVGGWSLLRTWELVRAPREMSDGRRVWHVLALVDLREVVRGTASLSVRLVVRGVAFLALALGGAWVAHTAPSWGLSATLAWVVRALGAVVLIYAVPEAVEPLVRALYAMAGYTLAPQHEDPILSRTLGEWWGSRWNRVVGRWLRERCFMPWARRRRARVGMAVSFVVSALYHAYFTLAALGWKGAAWMGGFFLLQGALVLTESALGVGRWPEAAQRSWTLGWLLVTSPLFTMPLLQVLGV